MSKIVIGQWAQAGKLVPIKLLLEIACAEYEFVQKQGDEKNQLLNEQIIPKIRDIHKFLNKKDYLLGYLTAADLYLLPAAFLFKQNLPQVYSEFAGTFDPFLIRMQQIPQIAAYLSDNKRV
ncbi:hypothetical protein ABPG73_005962 [Tetrahymena malaccensis]